MRSGSRNLFSLTRLRAYSVPVKLVWLFSLLVLLLSAASCEPEFGRVTPETTQLSTKLMNEFHEQEVRVVIQNATELDVTFFDSRLNDLTQDDRVVRAGETVLFMTGNYVGIGQITGFVVSFQAHEKRFLVVPDTRGVNLFVFDKNGTLTAGKWPEPD